MKSKKRKSNGGFTLVELLATLAVLSLVVSIVTYSAVGIVNNAKKKSYETTVNNIKVAAGNYVIETGNKNNSLWMGLDKDNCVSQNSCEFSCVTVEELINAGYFSNDILSSFTENGQVRLGTTVYVEKDAVTKTVVSKQLDYSFCASLFGSIEFISSHSDWTNQNITIKIKYNLNDVGENYTLSYKYTNDSSVAKTWSSNKTTDETVTVDVNGDLIAEIKDKNGNIIAEEIYAIKKIDKSIPNVIIDSTNNLSKSQTVTITMSDSGHSGLYYYFGTINPDKEMVSYTDAVTSVNKTVASSGTYYVSVKDGAGNVKNKFITFYQTDFNILYGHGNVNPPYIITQAEKSVKLPSVGNGITLNSGYSFSGWYGNSACLTDLKDNSYIPELDATLYGCVYIPRPTYYNIEFDSTGGSSVESQSVASGDTVKKPSDPSKEGYKFAGWYIETSEYDFSSKVYSDFKLTAKWISNTDNPTRVVANLGLVYNGSPQNLVTAMDVQGTIYYSTKSIEHAISSKNKTVPNAINAGTYKVYWYVSESGKYKSNSGSVSPIIDKANGYIELGKTLNILETVEIDNITSGTNRISFEVTKHHGGVLNTSLASSVLNGNIVTINDIYQGSDNEITTILTSAATLNYKSASTKFIMVRFGYEGNRRNTSWSSDEIKNKINELKESGYINCGYNYDFGWSHWFVDMTYSGYIYCLGN